MSLASPLAVVLLSLLIPRLAMPSQTSFDQLISDLETLRAEHTVPGFAVTLVSGEHGLLTAGGGVADRDSGRPVTSDTLFRIGSITKTFNALAVLLLVEQGRLDLDTPLRKIVADPPLDNPWADKYPVRVAHLLEHSSGLLDMTREEFDHNEPFSTLEAAFAWRRQARVVQWPPGLHHLYSNANAGLAGLVIERVSRQDYAHFISRRLLRPLGMDSASLSGDKRVLDAASVERMEQPATTLGVRNGLSYGYGPGLGQSLHKGFRWYGHGGDGDGYLSHFGYNREAEAGYFLTINAFKHGALRAMTARVRDHLTHGLAAPRPPTSRIDPETLGPLTGTYVAVTRRFDWQDADRLNEDRLQVVLEDGALYTRCSNGRRLLIPADTHLFRRHGQPLATIAIADQDGDLYLQAEFGNYRRVER